MTNDPRLERYLGSLEKSLQSFPVSDRAEIITEIKSHIYSALERDPSTNIDTILKSLGEPETVANRYLLERGLQPAKTSIHPMVKWLVIGFLGTFAILVIGTVMLISHMGSIVKIDDDHDHVQILGGLIDVNGSKDQVTVHGLGTTASTFMGKDDIHGGHLTVKFSTGKIQFHTSTSDKLEWSCKASGIAGQNVVSDNEGSTFDLEKADSALCEFGVPQGITLHLSGKTGKVSFAEPRFNINAEVTEGKVTFEPEAKIHYKFDLKVDEGKLGHFDSSDDAKAYAIKIYVHTGKIGNAD